MSTISNARAPSGFGPSESNAASKSSETNSRKEANSSTGDGHNKTPHDSAERTEKSSAQATGTSPKMEGKGQPHISESTKQGIDALISKFDSFLQLREQTPSLSGRIPLGSPATGRPGAKGELKYVTHPLVLNARAALMSPEGRQKKPDVANEDEQRGTKLEEILFRRRPSLRTPAGSPSGGAMGNEKERISLQHSVEILGNVARNVTSNSQAPRTSVTANSAAFNRALAEREDSKMQNGSFEKPITEDKNIEPPSKIGTVIPSGKSSGKPTAANFQIPPFNHSRKNSRNPQNGSPESVSSNGSLSGRDEKFGNSKPSYPHSSPVTVDRLEIPPYKSKSGSPSNNSRARSHVDASALLTKANSPCSGNQTAASQLVPAQIPTYQSKRGNRVLIADVNNPNNAAKTRSPTAKASNTGTTVNDAEPRNVTSKNGYRTGFCITVPDIPPFKPKTQGPQQPVVHAVNRTNGSEMEQKVVPAPSPSTNKYATAKIPVPESLANGTQTTRHLTPQKTAPLLSPSGSSQKPRSGNSSPVAGGPSSNKQPSMSAKPPVLPTSSGSSSKSKIDLGLPPKPTSPHCIKTPEVSMASKNAQSPSPPKTTRPKEDKSKPIDPKKLRLQNTWTLSYDSRTGSKPIYGNKEKYESNLQTVCVFDNVADFCGVCNNVPKPSQMEINSNYHLFKNGIKPMWEDPANSKGGSWTMLFGRQSNPEFINKCWTSLQCAAVGEMLDPDDDICGVVLNRRGRGDRMSVWVREVKDKQRNEEIRKCLDDLLNLTSERVTVEFTLHEDFRGSGILYGK